MDDLKLSPINYDKKFRYLENLNYYENKEIKTQQEFLVFYTIGDIKLYIKQCHQK